MILFKACKRSGLDWETFLDRYKGTQTKLSKHFYQKSPRYVRLLELASSSAPQENCKADEVIRQETEGHIPTSAFPPPPPPPQQQQQQQQHEKNINK